MHLFAFALALALFCLFGAIPSGYIHMLLSELELALGVEVEIEIEAPGTSTSTKAKAKKTKVKVARCRCGCNGSSGIPALRAV